MEIVCPGGKNILKYLLEKNVMIDMPCAGNGSCGKCRIKLIAGDLPVTKTDKEHLSEEELSTGIRLACAAVPDKPVRIELNELGSVNAVTLNYKSAAYDNKVCGIAIDIGTTTIAAALTETQSGRILDVYSAENSQRRFGADIVTRIRFDSVNRNGELTNTLLDDMVKLLNHFAAKYPGIRKNIRKIVISANTTMIHTLLGKNTASLGVYPFAALTLGGEEMTLETLLRGRYSAIDKNTPVYILKGFSAHIGADIASGITALGLLESDKTAVLCDLGTNAETALVKNKRIYALSAPAGPALEGGNISCGCAGVDGAVCSVKIQDSVCTVKTINNKPVCGVCGTGVIDCAAELLKNGLVDKTGRLHDRYFIKGYPLTRYADGRILYFTQDDIRQLQLAKSAVASGIEILLKRTDTSPEDIDCMYIAGGFGYYLNTDSAAAVGLLPRELCKKARLVGNTSLMGAVKLCRERDNTDMYNSFTEIILSNDEDFNSSFIENINFTEE